MATSNQVDQGRPNGHNKSPEQIQQEIASTRSAITDDLLALSEKFSPEQLRASAREALHEARIEVQDVLREAKDSAIGALRNAKERAIATIGERLTALGEQLRDGGALTLEFAARHAFALSLFGAGTGWLLLALRKRYRLPGGEPAYRYEHYLAPISVEEREPAAQRVRSVATQASRAVDQARERVRSSAHDLGERAAELRERTGQTLRRAAGHSRAVVSDQRVAAVALTVAAGVGLGLLLPVGRGPQGRRATARARRWHEAVEAYH